MAIVFEPGEFVAKLAVLVPPPRFHLACYAGVLAPGAKLRAEVVLDPPDPARPGPPEAQPVATPRAAKVGPVVPRPGGPAPLRRDYTWRN